MTLDELRTARGETILSIAQKHGVAAVKVFGSFAGGGRARTSSIVARPDTAGGGTALRSDLFYVSHILECADRIKSYCRDGEYSFYSKEIIQDAVLRNLQLLAESSQRISSELKSRYPEVDWRGLSGFRNVLVHDYSGIDVARIWRIRPG